MPTHQILHSGDATVDYVCSMVMLSNGHPPTLNITTETVDRVVCEGYPTFILVQSHLENRKYGGSSTAVHKFVLMDGSSCLMKAATDSNLSYQLRDVEFSIGSSIVVLDHLMLWVKCDLPLKWRSVMVIKKMTWRQPPSKDSGALVHKIKLKVESEMIKICSSDGSVVFPTVCQKTVNACCDKEVALGKWIVGDLYQFDWKYFCKRMVEENGGEDDTTVSSLENGNKLETSSTDETPECGCCTDFGFSTCILIDHPVSKLDKEFLFLSVNSRFLNDAAIEKRPNRWRDLSRSHKRWCLYWWYAVNVYQMRSSAGPLPSCFLDHVRSRYPNENGEKKFTGYKTSAERAKHKLRKP